MKDDNGTLIWPPSCQPGEAAAEFMFGAFEYVKLATYSVIPFIIILTLNIAIVIRLRHTTPLLRHARHGQSCAVEAFSLHTIGGAESTVIGRQMSVVRSCEPRQESKKQHHHYHRRRCHYHQQQQQRQ